MLPISMMYRLSSFVSKRFMFWLFLNYKSYVFLKMFRYYFLLSSLFFFFILIGYISSYCLFTVQFCLSMVFFKKTMVRRFSSRVFQVMLYMSQEVVSGSLLHSQRTSSTLVVSSVDTNSVEPFWTGFPSQVGTVLRRVFFDSLYRTKLITTLTFLFPVSNVECVVTAIGCFRRVFEYVHRVLLSHKPVVGISPVTNIQW